MEFEKSHYEKVQFNLWDDELGYAKILTYKNNDMKITKQFIKANADKTLKEVFPEICVPVLEVGKWYKWSGIEYETPFNIIICITEFTSNSISRYGFVNSRWNDDYRIYTGEKYKEACDNFKPATESEVFEALKNEAVKRGYGELEIHFNSVSNINCVSDIKGFDFWNKDSRTVEEENRFNISVCKNGGVIYRNGKWATIIPIKEMTQSDIEKELGYKIKII